MLRLIHSFSKDYLMKNIFFVIALVLLAAGRISAQCITYSGCSGTPTEICDLSTNDAQFWNEMYWWDNATQTHDLAEGPSDLSFTLASTCDGLVFVKYTLFLDLDGDQIMETVIQSDSTGAAGLGWNKVPYNNLGNPNYSGGNARSFDERPVLPTDKYGFALETQTVGDTTIARLRWNTFNNPGDYVLPQLPGGTHKIKWEAMDSLGNFAQCTQVFEVKDCKKPIVVCLNNLNVNIMPTGFINLWATDFLQYAEDNNTPSSQIKIGIRKSGTGTGFPLDFMGNPNTSVIFDCDELGPQPIELWAKDLAGNADYCDVILSVQDFNGNCNQNAMAISTCIESHCNSNTPLGIIVNIDGTSSFTPPYSFFNLMDSVDINGCLYGPPLNIPIASTFTIAPEKDDFPTNGVTVLDLIKIRRWILGLETDLSPYGMIAADANKSGSITGFDVIELRKLIVGTYTDFPNNTSWRFVDGDFAFPNPLNPFQTAFPESISIADALESAYQVDFKAIKIGDLDCDAWLGLGAPSQDRGLPSQVMTLPDATLLPGETAQISLQMAAAGNWYGLQAELQFDPAKLEIMEVLTGDLPGLDEDAFNQPKPGALRFIWANEQEQRIVPGQDLLTLRVRALEPVKISEAFHLATDFENLGRLGDEPQSLALDFRQNDAFQMVGETTILSPQPNPTSAGASLPVKLSAPGAVRIEISDLSGKTTWSNTLELSAGSHLLGIEPQAMPQAGVYVWRVTAGNKTGSGVLVRN